MRIRAADKPARPMIDRFGASVLFRSSCGRSSEVERQLPKLNVEGSIPFARSKAKRVGIGRAVLDRRVKIRNM